MASGYSFSSTTDPDNNTLAYDKNGRLKIISVPPVDVSVTNPITNDGNTLGLNYDNETLNLSSGTGAPLQINLANANTWTAEQTINPTTAGAALAVGTGGVSFLVNTSTNKVTTAKNTLDDGSGNLTIGNQLNIFQNTSGIQAGYTIIDSFNGYRIFYTTLSKQLVVGGDYSAGLLSRNNTLDDGSGNATFTTSGAGIVSVNGIKTTAGAATAVTVGASPYTYTNSSASNQQVFIQGGTVSAISFNPNGGTGIALSGLTDNVITMRPNDTLTITYTAAPTVNTIQL